MTPLREFDNPTLVKKNTQTTQAKKHYNRGQPGADLLNRGRKAPFHELK